MSTLVDITNSAIAEFNNAQKYGNYDRLRSFLSNPVIVHRVDDSTPIQGTPQQIVDEFNHSQTSKWPRLVCNDFLLSQLDQNVVLGTGLYYDQYAVAPTAWIHVRCSYHFVNNLIDVAFVVPHSVAAHPFP